MFDSTDRAESAFEPDAVHAVSQRRGLSCAMPSPGAPIDHTTAPIGRSVVMLRDPHGHGNDHGVESSRFADIFWVAHLGANCHAVVGLTESMMIIVYSVAMGVSIGATALVARRIVKRNPPKRPAPRHRLSSSALALSVVIGCGGASALQRSFEQWAPMRCRRDRLALYASDVGGKRDRLPLVPHERDLSRRR